MVSSSNSTDSARLVEHILAANKHFILLTPYRNYPLYQSMFALSEVGDLTIVVTASAQSIVLESESLKHPHLIDHVLTVSMDMFPNQVRGVLQGIAAGRGKVLFVTPESFVQWFGACFRSDHSSGREDELQLRTKGLAQQVLGRVTHAVLCDFDVSLPCNIIHKPKYASVLKALSNLPIRAIGLASNCTPNSISFFSGLFPEPEIHHQKFYIEGVSLRVKYCFNKITKRASLLKLLNGRKSTLVYIPPKIDARDLIHYLRQANPDLNFKVLNHSMPPESKTEAIDYLLNDPCPTLLTSEDITTLIRPKDLKRLIYYSAPASLAKFYRDINHLLRGRGSEAHLVTCEDDFGENSGIFVSARSEQYRREGLSINSQAQKLQIVNWLSGHQSCRWASLERCLVDVPSIEVDRCHVCDICIGEKPSLFSKLSLFMLKNSLQLINPLAINK